MDIGKVISDIERQASSGNDINYLHFNTWMEFINKVGSFLLSLLLGLLLILLPLVIVAEVVYISFPTIRVNVVDRFLFKGDGRVQKAAQLTLHDAMKAIEMANTVKTGKPAMLIYMRIKLKWLLLVAISLTIYLGGIDIIISLAIELFSGLIDVIIDAL